MDKDKRLVWDCGSVLYDSFEIKTLMQQLDSAISSRCMSMPHSSENTTRPAMTQARRKQSKFSRSIQKLLRSVFRVKSMYRVQVQSHGHEDLAPYGGACLWSGRLESIPEVCEKEMASPEIDAAVSRTISERLTGTDAKTLAAISW